MRTTVAVTLEVVFAVLAIALLVVAPIIDTGGSGRWRAFDSPAVAVVGAVLAAAGFALLLPNAWAFGAFAALLVGLELQVRYVEEPYLLGVHGDTYVNYTARAGRFVPGVGTTKAAV